MKPQGLQQREHAASFLSNMTSRNIGACIAHVTMQCTHQLWLLTGMEVQARLVWYTPALLLLCCPGGRLPLLLLLLLVLSLSVTCWFWAAALLLVDQVVPDEAVAIMPAMVVPMVVSTARLQLQYCLTATLQCAIVDVLHHHEHVCYDKVPACSKQHQSLQLPVCAT